ncbi:hypothetical protein JZ00_30370 [Pseudomonas frederiksbergensis]|uniref:Uncharacterized protein n=1 Tax=Pseudomonas frederiksbergensis TaxID=104087 RepID=A0A0U1PQQ2_9PSED|nr:hypothetical protein JZ00_30370 [Pseudomonas frederiksbergensis]
MVLRRHTQGQMRTCLIRAKDMVPVLNRLSLSQSRALARGPKIGIRRLETPGPTRTPRRIVATAVRSRLRRTLIIHRRVGHLGLSVALCDA